MNDKTAEKRIREFIRERRKDLVGFVFGIMTTEILEEFPTITSEQFERIMTKLKMVKKEVKP